MPSLVRIGSVSVCLGDGDDENLNDYSLSKAAPTMETVEEVIQLFESGGKVRARVPCAVRRVEHRQKVQLRPTQRAR